MNRAQIIRILSIFAFLLLTLPISSLNTSFIPPGTFQSATAVNNPGNTIAARSKFQTNPLSMSLRAWTCHGKTNREMVEKLASAGIIKSKAVEEAFLKVDRKNYVASSATSSAYQDAPQAIGGGQTISAPHMHAHATEEMMPTLAKFSREEKELNILDVGCGSGYLTAALGRLVDKRGPVKPLAKGNVYGIEVIPDLVQLSRKNIMKGDRDLFDSKTVFVGSGDGWAGLPEHAPYHAIHVGAAAETFPRNLMMQLHPNGGVMVIPVGPNGGVQNLYRVERLRGADSFSEKDFSIHTLLGVRYVPLVQTGHMRP